MSIDPYMLYPVWSFRFNFNQSIGEEDGIDVGALGDTSQILYAQPYGHLGTLGTATTAEPTSTTNAIGSSGFWIVIAITATLMLIVSVPIALRYKIRRKK